MSGEQATALIRLETDRRDTGVFVPNIKQEINQQYALLPLFAKDKQMNLSTKRI